MKTTDTTSTTMGFASRLALLITAIGICAIIAAAGTGWFFYSQSLLKAGYGQLASVSQHVRDSLSTSLADFSRNTALLAASQSAYEAVSAPDAEAARSAGSALAALASGQGHGSLFLINAQGSLAYSTSDKLTAALASASKDTKSPISTLLASILNDGKTLSILAPSGPTTSQGSIEVPAVLTGSPIQRDGQTLGILVCETPLDPVNEISNLGNAYQNYGLGESGQVLLLDSDFVLRNDARSLGPKSAHSRKITGAAARAAAGGNSGSLQETGLSGNTVLSSYGPVPIASANWILVVEQDRAEVLGPLRQAGLWVAASAVVLIVLAAAAAITASQIFARPLLSLRDTVGKLLAGDDSARAPVLTRDEAGHLAASLNQLIDERNAARERIADDNRRLQANIQELLLAVAEASEGNLGVRARKVEGLLGNIADALNRMLENVGILIGEAKRTSTGVGHAAGEIISSAQELTQGADQQTSQVLQTIRDIEGLAKEARQVAEHSSEAAGVAAKARQTAEEGARAMQDVIHFMATLLESFEANALLVRDLGERTREISSVVKYINDISAETDVLAMNASIEAARAGEQGKGFTVVADQVRALADRTRLATVEIENLVGSIQNQTIQVVAQIEDQARDVELGTQKAGSAGEALGKIVDSSVDSSALVQQISGSARQQENRAQLVVQAALTIRQIAEDAQRRTARFQQTSDELLRLAQQLDQQLANFSTGLENAAATDTAPASP
jgi:methyl-accepting chemotaxis protein